MRNWLYSIYGRIRSILYTAFAFWFITVGLVVLIYMILIQRNFSLTLIISFCMLLSLWLSIIVDYFNKARNIPEEVYDLTKNFKQDYNIAKRYIQNTFYNAPFFIIIGEAAAGKTTLIKSSHLTKFEASQRDDEKGMGGTQGCDWFFRKEAFLLDTQGKMMEGGGIELWEEFLKRVKNVRPRYPVNGVLIVVPIDQLCDPCNYQEERDEKVSYDIFSRQITKEEEKKLAEKAENIKIRLNELRNTLNFDFPVYFVFSKCDLLAGFSNFRKVLLEGLEEENKMLGMANYEEFDAFVDQLHQWQTAKALEGYDVKDLWLFLQNLGALKDRVWIYNQVLSEFTKPSHAAMVSRSKQVPFFRGYFFSSCRQYYVNEQDEWEEKFNAYFTRDLFQEKLLSETKLAHPVQSVIGEQIEPKRKFVRIATVAAMVGLLFWVIGYFLRNHQNFSVLENYSYEFLEFVKSEDKGAAQTHRQFLDKILEYEESSRAMDTQSLLFIGSRSPLEKQIEKTALDYFYYEVVEKTLREFLRDLDEHFQEKKNQLDRQAKDLSSLDRFVKAVNHTVRLWELYEQSKQNLEGFPKIYQLTHYRQLANNPVLQQNIKDGLNKVAELTRDYQPEWHLETVEENAYAQLQQKIKDSFRELMTTSAGHPPRFLARSYRLWQLQKKIADVHQDLTQRYSLQVLLEELQPAIAELEKEFSFGNQVDATTFYRTLFQEDFQKGKDLLKNIEDKLLAQELLKTYELTEEQAQRQTLELFQAIRLATVSGGAEFAKVYPQLQQLAKQAQILKPLKKKEQSSRGYYRQVVPQLIERLEKNKSTQKSEQYQENSWAEYELAYERDFQEEWDEEIYSFSRGFWGDIKENFRLQIVRANQGFLDRGIPRTYLKDIRDANRDFTRDVEDLDKLNQLLGSVTEEDLERWKEIDNKKIEKSLRPFLDRLRRSLNEKRRYEWKKKIEDNRLTERQKKEIFAIVPEIYNNRQYIHVSDIPQDVLNPVSNYILLDLKYQLTQELGAEALKRIYFTYWQKKCQQWLTLDFYQAENWHSEFEQVYRSGEDFTRKLLRLYDRQSDNEIEKYYRQLLAFLSEQVEKLFSVAHMRSHMETLHLDNTGKVFNEQLAPKAQRYHEISLLIRQDIEELFKFQTRFGRINPARDKKELEQKIKVLNSYFRRFVLSWFLLRLELQNRYIEEIKSPFELEDWIGKKVLENFQAYRKFEKELRRFPQRDPREPFIKVGSVLQGWDRELRNDYNKWYKAAIRTLYQLFQDTTITMRNRFPFVRGEEREASLEEISLFFQKFTPFQEDIYQQSLLADKQYGRESQAIFRTFLPWKKLFYQGEFVRRELDKIEVEVIVKSFPPHTSSTGIHYMKFGSLDLYDMTRYNKNSFIWKLFDDISVTLKVLHSIQGQERVEEVPISDNLQGRWKLFRLIDKYLDKTIAKNIRLAFPYKHTVFGQRKAKEALLTIEIKNLELPWQRKKYD